MQSAGASADDLISGVLDDLEAKRQVCTPGFKLRAVRVVAEQKLSVAEAARRLGIHESRLHEWKKAHLKDGAAAFSGPGHQTPLEEESRRLKAEVERDILRKATAFFAALTE